MRMLFGCKVPEAARVLEVRGSGLSGLLAGAEAVEIRPRTG